MTREERETIAETIGIMEMGAEILRNYSYDGAADLLFTQCETLQAMLDNNPKTEAAR